MKLLVTGFGPFGDILENPSQGVAEVLGSEGMQGHSLRTEVFPVSYRLASERLAQALLAEHPDIALLLGASSNHDAVHLELRAMNRASNIPDEDGDTVRRMAGKPEYLYTRADLHAIAHNLRVRGFQAEVSTDAGGYVCNHVYYAGLFCCERHGLATTLVFVHLPAPPEVYGQPGRSRTTGHLEQMVGLVRVMLAHLIARPERAESERAGTI